MTPPPLEPAFAADLARMADQVAAQFDHRPPLDAAESVATHLHQFWSRDMVTVLTGALAEDPTRAHPVVLRAAQLLANAP